MSDREHENNDEQAFPNIEFPTLGGKQLWTDYMWRQGWRLQQNAITKHWRLLDERSIRKAWGNRVRCERFLDREGPENLIAEHPVFVLLHGLFRSSTSMLPISTALKKEFDCTVIDFGYASSRGSIAEHAKAFRELISSLPKGTSYNCIAHSMGNIVVRYAIGDWQRAEDDASLERLQRIVMLGPPNQGAALARQLSNAGIFKIVSGPGGVELGAGWEQLQSRLATPTCPFGIIAGRLTQKVPQNPLIEDGSDFVVGVEETKLDGATAFLEVPVMHTFLMQSKQVQDAIVNFMNSGAF